MDVIAIVTPPSFEPVTLDEAKLHLRVTHDMEDDLISALISAARELCEVEARRQFVSTVYDWTIDCFPVGGGYYNRAVRQQFGTLQGGGFYPGMLPSVVGALQPPKPPLVSVESITYINPSGESAVMPTADYKVIPGDPGRIVPTYGKIWPVSLPQFGAITIRFTAGEPDATTIPAAAKAAVKLTIGHLFENRENVVVGTIATEIPFTVKALLASCGSGLYA